MEHHSTEGERLECGCRRGREHTCEPGFGDTERHATPPGAPESEPGPVVGWLVAERRDGQVLVGDEHSRLHETLDAARADLTAPYSDPYELVLLELRELEAKAAVR